MATDEAGGVVAVRAYFPGTILASVRQKARWMTGIALAGWDRTGWAPRRAFADHWMRMRDRRAPLVMVVLAVAYLAMLAWAVAALLHWQVGAAIPYPVPHPVAFVLLVANALLLTWRLTIRMIFTGRSYGLREALWSLPRFLVGNLVALIAAPRAVIIYIGMLRGAPPVWDKTRHEFPDRPALELADALAPVSAPVVPPEPPAVRPAVPPPVLVLVPPPTDADMPPTDHPQSLAVAG